MLLYTQAILVDLDGPSRQHVCSVIPYTHLIQISVDIPSGENRKLTEDLNTPKASFAIRDMRIVIFPIIYSDTFHLNSLFQYHS